MRWGSPTRVALASAIAVTFGCNSDTGSDAFDSAGGSSSAASDPTGAGPSGGPSGGSDNPSAGGSSAADDSSGGVDDTDDIKLDVGSPTGGFGSCECELVYLWVADYEQGTVSKINTRTMVE